MLGKVLGVMSANVTMVRKGKGQKRPEAAEPSWTSSKSNRRARSALCTARLCLMFRIGLGQSASEQKVRVQDSPSRSKEIPSNYEYHQVFIKYPTDHFITGYTGLSNIIKRLTSGYREYSSSRSLPKCLPIADVAQEVPLP